MDSAEENVKKELYFLIAKFLENGPCKRSAETLLQELDQHALLARRLDWEGNTHLQLYQETAHQNRHIPSDFLVQICSRLGPLLEKCVPSSIKGVRSLLGAGRQSLLRTGSESIKPTISSLAVCNHGAPLLPPMGKRMYPNVAQSLLSREISGTAYKRQLAQPNIYVKQSMHRRILGHLSAVYCVLFDRTGQCIITGADDSLVKIWSTKDGRLLATLRGHQAEISDIAINHENTLVAAGSCDKLIRVWSTKTTYPIAVLQGHTGMITSLQFCPCVSESRYLMSTGGDGTVCFWKWDPSTLVFDSKPIRFIEKSRPGTQMVCSSFSPGGSFLVAGSTDHIIRIYQMAPGPPERIAELDVHVDHVDSIQFDHSGEKFLSGSRDGTARIWFFKRSKWEHILLDISKTLPGCLPIDDALKSLKPRVTMVAWDLWDHYVVTAINDHTLKVWDAATGSLVHVLQGHHDEMFVLEAHPKDPYVFLSAGHDGLVILWDLRTGKMIKSFFNSIEGQGHGAVFDCKFSPDGLQFACTDSHGHLCIFGYGSSDPFSRVPSEQFFHTDYRPLIRDANSYVLDEQTQTAPHLMPPPFLVDVDGNPHPMHFQRLVPGHGSNVRTARQPQPAPRAELPPLLAEIEAAEQTNQGPGLNSPPRPGAMQPPLQSPGGSRNYGMRQSGDVEGVRQAHGNVPVIEDVAEADVTAWRKRTIAPDLKPSAAKHDEERRLALGKQEIMSYLREKKKKRPQPSAAARAIQEAVALNERSQRNQQRRSSRQATRSRDRARARAARAQRNTYATRATMAVDVPEESGEDDVMVWVTPSESEDEEEEWNESSSESSEYSDWTEEVGIRAQPQSENRRTRRVRRVFSSSDDDTEAVRPGPSSPQRASKQKTEKKDKKPVKKKKLPKKPKINDVQEMLSYYQPPDWLMCVKPRLSPYLPQIGDEVYYFRQGHELYVKEVMKHKLYDTNPKKQCYYKLRLKGEELCRIVSLHFSTSAQGPPTLCCLKLASINSETGSGTGASFTVRYHDMPDVLDFIILRQYYDRSVARNWQQGDRFRSIIDECWWAGEITERSPVEAEFPNSQFMCLTVQWDTGETERMSPWDLEPVTDQDFQGADSSGAATSNIPLTDEERQALSYVPTELDWFEEGREEMTTRILSCMESLCQLSLAGPFVYPVDVQAYPDYWSVVPYPIDLSTVIDKLENRFYRRANALIWDIKQLERNARLYNEEDSQIVKNSTKLVSVLAEFIRDSSCLDILSLVGDEAEEAGEIEVTQMSEESGAEETTDEPSNDRGKRKRKKESDRSRRQNKRQRQKEEEEEPVEEAWVTSGRTLLNFLMSREDAEPFLAPVNLDDFPDYTEFVQEPMDFSTVARKFEEGQYSDPDAFVRDIRLVLSNSRSYNTLPRSRIYSMTIRLSAMFEDRVDSIFSDWYACASGGARRTRLRTQQLLQSQGAPSTSNDVTQSQGAPITSSNVTQSQGAPSTSSDVTPTWRIVSPQETNTTRVYATDSMEESGYSVVPQPSGSRVPLRTTIRLPHTRMEAAPSSSTARVPPIRISVRTIAEVSPPQEVSPPERRSARPARPSRAEVVAPSNSTSSSTRRKQTPRSAVVVNGDATGHQYSTRRRSRLVSEESRETNDDEDESRDPNEDEDETRETNEDDEEDEDENEENGEEEDDEEEGEEENGEEDDEESEESDESEEDSSSEAQPFRRSTVRPKLRPTALPRKTKSETRPHPRPRSRTQSSASSRSRGKSRSRSTSADLDTRHSRRTRTRPPAMSYAESESESDSEVITVSSRGRVRRPTQRMLDYLE